LISSLIVLALGKWNVGILGGIEFANQPLLRLSGAFGDGAMRPQMSAVKQLAIFRKRVPSTGATLASQVLVHYQRNSPANLPKYDP